MKRLMFLISSEGKSPNQLKNEVMVAYKKYWKVKKQVMRKLKIKNEKLY